MAFELEVDAMFEAWGFRGSVLMTLALLAGCTICDNCDDPAYSGYGGKWQRTDRYHGRVGSIFSPAGAPHGMMSATPEIITTDAPVMDAVPWDADATWESEAPSNAPGIDDASVIEMSPPLIAY